MATSSTTADFLVPLLSTPAGTDTHWTAMPTASVSLRVIGPAHSQHAEVYKIVLADLCNLVAFVTLKHYIVVKF